jgi:cation:H+ antiporter
VAEDLRDVAYLIFGATQHPAQGLYGSVMLYFVLPLTAITLLVLMVRAYRIQHAKQADQASGK